AAGMPECTWPPLLPRSFGPRAFQSLLSATAGMKPTMGGSDACGVGPDQSPIDRYPPHVAEAKAQRLEADSSIGHLSTGGLALRRGVIEVGGKDPKLGRLLLNWDVPPGPLLHNPGVEMSFPSGFASISAKCTGVHYIIAAWRLSVRTSMSITR